MTFIGKIYKIKSSKTDNVYIGSTTKTLKQRLSKHKSDYKRYVNGSYHFITSFEILKHDDAIIELIEEKQFKDKNEMYLRERHFIENTKCINSSKRPTITHDEGKRERENIKCACGSSYKNGQQKRHNRTQKHMNHMKTINITINITCEKVDIMKTE